MIAKVKISQKPYPPVYTVPEKRKTRRSLKQRIRRVFPEYGALSDVARNFFRIAFTEKKRNTPDPRKGYDRIYDPADQSILTAEDPRDDIEAEKTDASPVERAYDSKNKRNSVEHNITSDSHSKRPSYGTFLSFHDYLSMFLSFDIPYFLRIPGFYSRNKKAVSLF